ncbi:MAG: flagellar basal body P-ring formation chaperone FlgA [Pseudomonadota bacterium]|nr:flagellar basal body P-ring formation chaperone FlgA [Pseudomonadota bacterium]
MRTIFLVITGLILAPLSATANPTRADDIRAAANTFLNHWAQELEEAGFRASYTIGNLDSRLRLAPCETALSLEFTGDPMQSTSPSLLVSCQGERPWRMFVTASIEVFGPALVAARPLARGERLTEALLTTQEVQVNASRKGALTDPAAIEGMRMRRPVNAGTVMSPDLLEAPHAIERGDHVIIVASSGGFSVSTRGKALDSAEIGEQVLVENLRSARTIKATATAPGRVEIPM